MKKKLLSALLVSVSVLAFNSTMNAQAFHKGSLIVSVSEGSTYGYYKTIGTYSSAGSSAPGSYRSVQNNGESNPVVVHQEFNEGARDPFILEYGITNRLGIGFTSGNDIFSVSPTKFYGFDNENHQIKAKTSEFTFDSNYHFFVTKRLDLSVCGSFGLFGVDFKGKYNNSSDSQKYNYSAGGGMVRGGVRVHYYFYKRLGAFGMISTYAGSCTPNKNVSTNTVGANTTTKVKGQAIEAGLCFRFF